MTSSAELLLQVVKSSVRCFKLSWLKNTSKMAFKFGGFHRELKLQTRWPKWWIMPCSVNVSSWGSTVYMMKVKSSKPGQTLEADCNGCGRAQTHIGSDDIGKAKPSSCHPYGKYVKFHQPCGTLWIFCCKGNVKSLPIHNEHALQP